MKTPQAADKTKSTVRKLRPVVVAGVIALLACFPFVYRSVGSLLPGPINSVGSLTMLSMMLVIAALALTLYLLIGVAGMLSFGHALYFALGAYGSVMLANVTNLPFLVTAIVSVAGATLVAIIINGLALRAGVIGFSMITLAFAELMSLSVDRGYLGSGGDTGVILQVESTPPVFRGISNVPNLYWMALGLLCAVYGLVWLAEHRSRFGRVWISIRENELRAESLGFDVYKYKLSAAVFASCLASVCGVAYALVTGGAQPDITQVLYSLGLVLMVILGGRGVIWGALLGGLLYMYLTLRLPGMLGASANVHVPDFIAIPMTQPAFLLGLCFILIVLFLPGGIASGVRKLVDMAQSLYSSKRLQRALARTGSGIEPRSSAGTE